MYTFSSILLIFSLISLAVGFKKDPCGLEPYKGSDDNNILCRFGSQESWSYDADINGCSRFTYIGCEGNNNRFDTQEECESMCKTTDPCAMKPFSGDGSDDSLTCFMEVEQWSYDAETNKCYEYFYGGCGGNENIFNTPEDCESQCKKKEDTEAADSTNGEDM